MKSRRKHSFQFMTILYFVIVFCMCVSRFNVIMTIMGGQLTRVEEINLLPFHSVRENLQYGRNPISWDMLYNMVMFVPFGIIYCYYQKHFRVYKAVGMSCLTTFFINDCKLVLIQNLMQVLKSQLVILVTCTCLLRILKGLWKRSIFQVRSTPFFCLLF